MLAPGRDGGGEVCQTHDLWTELGRQIALFLRGITLADVVLGRVAGRAISLTPAGRRAE
jgi:Rrf2 family iron-sulfur cluster assembly transcriptional regulator